MDLVKGGGGVEGRTVGTDGSGQVGLSACGTVFVPELGNQLGGSVDIGVVVPELIHAGAVMGGGGSVGAKVVEKAGEGRVLGGPTRDGVTRSMVLVEGVGERKLKGDVVCDMGGGGRSRGGDGGGVHILGMGGERARVCGKSVGAVTHHPGVGGENGRLGRSVGGEDRVEAGTREGGDALPVGGPTIEGVEGLGDFVDPPFGQHKIPRPPDRSGLDVMGVVGGPVRSEGGKIFVATQEIRGGGVGGEVRPGGGGHDLC